MKIRLLSIALIAVLMASCSTPDKGTGGFGDNPLEYQSQRSVIYLGPLGGLNSVQHTGDLASFDDKNAPCPHFKTSNSTGFFGGFFFEFPFAKVGSKHSIQARFLYNTFPAEFNEIGDKYPSLVEDATAAGGYSTVESKTQHSLKVDYNCFTMEVLYRWNAWDKLAIALGPTIDIPITKTLVQKYMLLSPEDVQFKRVPNADALGLKYEDFDRTIIVPTYNSAGNIKDASGMRFGLKFGLQYEFLTKTGVDFIPGIFYNVGLSKVATNVDWRVHAIQVGCDIRFSMRRPF